MKKTDSEINKYLADKVIRISIELGYVFGNLGQIIVLNDMEGTKHLFTHVKNFIEKEIEVQ